MPEARLGWIEKGDDSGVTEVALCGPRLMSQATESGSGGTITPSIAWPFFRSARSGVACARDRPYGTKQVGLPCRASVLPTPRTLLPAAHVAPINVARPLACQWQHILLPLVARSYASR